MLFVKPSCTWATLLRYMVLLKCVGSPGVPRVVHAFELLPFQRYMLKSSTMYVSVEDHTPYGISKELVEVTQDAATEWNHVPHNRLQLLLVSPDLTRWIQQASYLLASSVHFHAGTNVHHNGAPMVAFTNFTFDARWSVPVRSSVHVYVDYFPDWTTLYNVVLHELGHVNLVGHTNIQSYYKTVASDTNIPIMGQTGVWGPYDQLQHQFKSRLEFDDVGAIMYRMFVEDSLPITGVVGGADLTYSVQRPPFSPSFGPNVPHDEGGLAANPDDALYIVDYFVLPYR